MFNFYTSATSSTINFSVEIIRHCLSNTWFRGVNFIEGTPIIRDRCITRIYNTTITVNPVFHTGITPPNFDKGGS